MAPSSPLLVLLGILNLLLAAMGLLMTYFDWSAARRREFLYLYFAEDKPGVNYFSAARRRRAQYTRLVIAFSFLFLAELVAAYLVVSMTDTAQLRLGIYSMRMLGLAALGLGFLYLPEQENRLNVDILFFVFLALWLLLMSLVVTGALGAQMAVVVTFCHRLTRFGLGAVILIALLLRGDGAPAAGLLPTKRDSLIAAFGLWFVGPICGLFSPRYLPEISVIIVGQLSIAFSLVIFVSMVARGVLSEYETVEGSRHRLGRERQVIVTYLQRIGSAFTTAVEVEQVLKIILESALETTEAQAGAIYLYHAETGLLEPRVVLNFFPPMHVDTPAALSPHRTEELEEEMKHQSFHLGEGIIGQVAQEGKARIIEDVRADSIMLGTTTEFMRNRSMLLVPLKIRDEPLGVMAVLNKQRGSFSIDDQFLLQALADQGALSINNAMLTGEVRTQERLKRDLQIARDIQQRLLPERCPVVPGFEIAARGSSATEVGGDYYDFFWVDDDKLGIVIADVSGKGVPAALTVAMMRSVFRTQARGNFDVRDVLTRVNEFMGQDLRRDMFITCVYGILEVSTHKFSWARAGHEPLIVAHPSAPIDILSPEGFALGVIESPTFEEMLEVQTVELHSGDRLLLFTDGLTEAMNSEGEEFGMQRILAIMDHPAKVNGSANGTSSNGKPFVPDDALRQAPPSTPELAIDDPEDLRVLDRAIERHVGSVRCV